MRFVDDGRGEEVSKNAGGGYLIIHGSIGINNEEKKIV